VSPVPFGDFRSQLVPLRAEIDAAIARVLDSGWFILGPEGEAFERELAECMGCPDAVAVANGTEAIQLALEAIGLEAGDEVVTSPLSAAFTVLGIERAGGRPVFADLDPRTLNVAPEAVAARVTSRTRAIVPVHLYGHPADMEPILGLAARHDLLIVEDACQAHGALYKGRTAGTLGVLGTHSYYPTKNLGALGDGGAILVNDPALAPRLRQLRNGGQSDRYRHELPGINSRLDELQAAVLRVKLRRLEQATARRREIAATYTAALTGLGLGLPEEQPWARAVYHLYVVRHARREALMDALKERGISTLIHYPIPLHLQPVFAHLGGRIGDLPVAESAASEVFSIPIYPEMSDGQVQQVTEALREALRSLPA
jgi:dTDP-4-amino-4,6-dideoxygalactose transaminase